MDGPSALETSWDWFLYVGIGGTITKVAYFFSLFSLKWNLDYEISVKVCLAIIVIN